MNFFDHLNNISWKKDFNIINQEENLSSFNEFMINRYLSMDKECLFYADLMNKAHNITNKTKYLFYLHMIPKRKRFFKYFKSEQIERLKIIQQYYKCSEEEALQYNEILDEKQVNNLKRKIESMKG